MASFRNIYTALLLVLAKATNKELARYVSFLKAENQLLRSRLPDRIKLTEREKNRLVRFGRGLGSALNYLCTIVHPDTLRRAPSFRFAKAVPNEFIDRFNPQPHNRLPHGR
jgi:putative transposase